MTGDLERLISRESLEPSDFAERHVPGIITAKSCNLRHYRGSAITARRIVKILSGVPAGRTAIGRRSLSIICRGSVGIIIA